MFGKNANHGVHGNVLAEKIVKTLSGRGETVAAAESCTAGLAADTIARIPGASKVFWGSFVSYTEDAKIKMLGVSGNCLKEYGAVSRETALAMAEGALEKSGASWAFSITGLAGPDGDGSDTQVGTVWVAVSERGDVSEGSLRPGGLQAGAFKTETRKFFFSGRRDEVREAAAFAALEMLQDFLRPAEGILTGEGKKGIINNMADRGIG